VAPKPESRYLERIPQNVILGFELGLSSSATGRIAIQRIDMDWTGTSAASPTRARRWPSRCYDVIARPALHDRTSKLDWTGTPRAICSFAYIRHRLRDVTSAAGPVAQGAAGAQGPVVPTPGQLDRPSTATASTQAYFNHREVDRPA